MSDIKEVIDFVYDRIKNNLPVTDRIIADHFKVTPQAIQQRRIKLQKVGMWPSYPRMRRRRTLGQQLKKRLQEQGIPVEAYLNKPNQNYEVIIEELRVENENLRRELLDIKISQAGAGVPGIVKLNADAQDFGLDTHNFTYHISCELLFSLPEHNIRYLPVEDTRYALAIN